MHPESAARDAVTRLKCRCPLCDSDPLPTYLPTWRAECEARWVLALPFEQRAAYLADVKKARGAEAGEQLERDVRAQHRRQRAAPPTPAPRQGDWLSDG